MKKLLLAGVIAISIAPCMGLAKTTINSITVCDGLSPQPMLSPIDCPAHFGNTYQCYKSNLNGKTCIYPSKLSDRNTCTSTLYVLTQDGQLNYAQCNKPFE